MAVSNLDKDNVSRLMESLAITELETSKHSDIMKYSSSCTTKLKVLYEQNEFIKEQVKKLVDAAVLNKKLHGARCNFKKSTGQFYHFYMDNKDSMFCSIIAPNEWNMYKEVVGTFYLDHDYEFIEQKANSS